MMRFVLPAALAALVAASGCMSGAPTAPPEPSRVQAFAPGETPPALNTTQEEAAPGGGAWQDLMRQLRQEYEVSAQQKAAQADEHYKLAERHYHAGDFDRAALECQKAVEMNPDHAAAHALLVEVNFIRNRGTATPDSQRILDIINQEIVRHQQLLVEIDNKMARGQRLYNLGKYDDAESEFRTILEYAKWMPTGVELDTRRKQAVRMLETVKHDRKQAKIDEEKARRARIEEEKVRDELARMLEQRRRLEVLFGQAQLHFEREEYEQCVRTCDRILYIEPNLTSVQEMRMVSLRLRHHRDERENLKLYVENWKRTFETIERNASVQAEDLAFPDRHIWERIRERKPRGLQEDLQEELDPQDREIIEKLKSIRITLDMQNAPLTAIVDYIREISGLNFHIAGSVDTPEDIIITIKVSDIILDGVLKLMLNPRDLAYYVEGGVVLITSQEQLSTRVRLELYDVQDLTYGLTDFPGVDISLNPEEMGTTIGFDEEGGTQQFTGEDLADLITQTIDPEGWDSDGKSIIYQNGLLIVRTTVQIHNKVRKFLTDLRASTGILVSVETRFLMVEDAWLHQVGMDIRDLDGPRAEGILSLDDINPAFVINPQFDLAGAATSPLTAGAGYIGGDSMERRMGMRVQHIMGNDFLVNRFFDNVLQPVGGGSMQYTLMDDVSFEALFRLVSRSERAHVLTAPKITLFNTQRGNVRIANQFTYIRDFELQIATAAVAPDPVVDIINDGISLDVRPIVSADRRFVTLELRPTVASLFPPPPDIFGLEVNLGIAGVPLTTNSVFIETPILNVQQVRTTVVVPDRGTLMLGGLSVYSELDAQSAVPVWRHVPILGNIGSNKFKGRQRQQFLVIARVRIIIPSEEERDLFD